MRIAIVTDAWRPQVNGVVTTLEQTRRELEGMGHDVAMVTPEGTTTVAMPTYPEIRLVLRPGHRVRKALEGFGPEAIHIATEGPLGLAARHYCLRRNLPFTTSFHTRFPEYARLRLPFLPLEWGYDFLRWFHRPAARTLVTNGTLAEELREIGLERLAQWPRGVDTRLFRPFTEEERAPQDGPRFIYVGRVAAEKNLEAFLRLDLPGSKTVVGDGPDLDTLRFRFPEARFTGVKKGEDLVRHLADADVFVFPSRTDTFGLVLLEAMACGLPVAAFPVQGPRNIVRDGVTGFLDEDLGRAARRALELDPPSCRAEALGYSWRAATRAFLDRLEPLGGGPAAADPEETSHRIPLKESQPRSTEPGAGKAR